MEMSTLNKLGKTLIRAKRSSTIYPLVPCIFSGLLLNLTAAAQAVLENYPPVISPRFRTFRLCLTFYSVSKYLQENCKFLPPSNSRITHPRIRNVRTSGSWSTLYQPRLSILDKMGAVKSIHAKKGKMSYTKNLDIFS